MAEELLVFFGDCLLQLVMMIATVFPENFELLTFGVDPVELLLDKRRRGH